MAPSPDCVLSKLDRGTELTWGPPASPDRVTAQFGGAPCSAVSQTLGRSTYADGKPRPFFRGVLHAAVSVLLLVASVTAAVAATLDNSSWWRLAAFTAAKLSSYVASAILHIYPFATIPGATLSLKVDLMFVPVSIGGTMMPFCVANSDVVSEVAASAFIVAVNALLTCWQFDGHIGLNTPAGKSDAPRTVVIVLHFVWSMAFIGRRTGFAPLWRVALAFYLAAFAVSVPVTAAHALEPMSRRVPWHKKHRNGWHEDFHCLLLAADGAFMLMGLQALLGDVPLSSAPLRLTIPPV